MASSPFSTRSASSIGPSGHLEAVTPNDAADLPGGACRGLFVGVAGTLVVQDARGATVEIISADSQYHPISVRRILAAGSTAGGVIALY